MTSNASHFTDRFIPPDVAANADPHDLHRLRLGLFHVWTGIAFASVFAVLYGLLGSPVSSAAVVLLVTGLAAAPIAFRRGVSLFFVGNGLVALTWLETAIVAWRSGGIASPILVHVVLFPLVTYAACGARSSIAWALLSIMQVLAFWLAETTGVSRSWPHDFSPFAVALLRVGGLAGVIVTIVLVLGFVASARRATFASVDANNRAVERARVLDDVHDGVGAQLLGLLVRVRAGDVDRPELVASLESCLDDLRVVVSSDAAREGDLSRALAEVRARFTPRFEAADITATWIFDVEGHEGGEHTLEIVRVLQELLTNVLRHARARRVEVRATRDQLSVRDDGIGLEAAPPSSGRGLRSMQARAARLGGSFSIGSDETGTFAVLRLPGARP